MYEPEKMKHTGHMFRVMSKGQIPDFWEVLLAINEISDLNATPGTDSESATCPNSPKCPDCG